MAVTVVKENNNLLGGLGTLTTLGGLATGTPWLTTLGTGLGKLGSAANGGSSDDGTGAISKILEGINGGWKVLTGGNIGKVKTDDEKEKEQATTNWSPIANPYVGGYNPYNGWIWGGNI